MKHFFSIVMALVVVAAPGAIRAEVPDPGILQALRAAGVRGQAALTAQYDLLARETARAVRDAAFANRGFLERSASTFSQTGRSALRSLGRVQLSEGAATELGRMYLRLPEFRNVVLNNIRNGTTALSGVQQRATQLIQGTLVRAGASAN